MPIHHYFLGLAGGVTLSDTHLAYLSPARFTQGLRFLCELRNARVANIRDFKNRGRGGSETRPEVIFPISDEERMRVAFSPELENAA